MNEPPPSGCSRPGQNQPSARKSVAAPSATRGLDRLAGVGAARRHRPGGVAGHVVVAAHRRVALEAAGGEQHAAAGADLDRSLGRHRGDAGHPAVVVGRPARSTGRLGRGSCRPRGRTIAASRAISDCPPLRVLRPPSPARSRSTGGRTSSATSGGRSAALDVGRLDRPAERHPAGRVVVLRERQPLEVEVRVGLELGDQLAARGARNASTLVVVGVLEDRGEVGARALGRVRDPGPLLDLRCRAASRRRRSTPRCRRSAASSRRRTPRARPWRPAPRRSAHRRPSRPRRRRTRLLVTARWSQLERVLGKPAGQRPGQRLPHRVRAPASRGRGRRGGTP